MDTEPIAAYLTTTPLTAQGIARGFGLTCREVVPVLNALRAEGRAVRVTLHESGLCGWRLP